MTLFISIFVIALIFSIVGLKKTRDQEWWFLIWTMAVLVLVGTGVLIANRVALNQLPKEKADIQLQITQAVEDNASSYERKTIRETIFKINKEILQAKRDNDSWLWGLQTPDVVDTIKPVRMFEVKQ